MADQQPGEIDPAAGTPEPTRVEGGEEPSTLDAPLRWSGSAAVPPPAPRKSRWSRRRRAEEFAPADQTDWAAVPPVDPWAGQDTPIDTFPAVPDSPAPPLPPTRIEPPPAPPAAAPAPAPSPVAAPPQPPKISRRERKARERAARDRVASDLAARERAARELAAARERMIPVARPVVNRLPVQTRPPLPAPPPWIQREPHRPLPPPRKRRRWGRRLLLFSLFGLVCCCGGPIAWFQFPTARQYPVNAVLPQSFADLTRRDDNASKKAADRLAEELKAANARTDGVFAGVYGDSRGKRVTVFGVTGFRFTPGSDVRTELDRLAGDFKLTGITAFDLGEPGAHEVCGTGRANGAAVVVCSWADHGSLATVLLTRRSMNDSADLVGRLRSEVLTPG